jgi:hypothetical protein
MIWYLKLGIIIASIVSIASGLFLLWWAGERRGK